MSDDNDDVFVHLWQKRMSTFKEQNPKSQADSLRFCLLQLDYLNKTNSDFQEEWSLDMKKLEFRKNYATLMDSKEHVNNYANEILSLSKGFPNESKNWKCNLEPSDFKNCLITDENCSEDDFEPEYAKLDALLQRTKPRDPQKYLEQKKERVPLNPMDVEPSPNFNIMEDCNLFDNESSCFSTIGNPSKVPNSSEDTRQNSRNSLASQRLSSFPTREFHTNSFDGQKSSSGFGRQSANDLGFEQRRREPQERSERKVYPWQALKSRQEACSSRGRGGEREERGERGWKSRHQRGNNREEEEQKFSSFRTASHQLDIENRKKFGSFGGRDSSSSHLSYGTGKRSLGARGIKGRFVPPVRREDEQEGYRTGGCPSSSYDADTDGSSGGSTSTSRHSSLLSDERLKGIDAKMVDLIMNEIMDSGCPVQWDDIAGLQLAKSTIQEIVVWPMLRPDIFTGLRGPPKGILLFGPPGTGKTMIGKCIASQSLSTFFSISASSLTSKWVGEGEKMVRAMFAVAKCHQPAVIFIDEIDSLLTHRSDTEHESSRRIKTEFLVQLDGVTSGADERILVVGATNRPHELDEAARRRLVKRLYIPLPDAVAREQIVKNLLTNQSHSLSAEEVKSLSEKADGYSGADMANLCREAALGPIRSMNFTNIQHISVDQVRPISAADFDAALNSIRASVSSRDLDLYEEWNGKYGINKSRS